MKTASVPRRGQVYSVGNYLMTGKVLGKGHFARVEEATHRIIGKKVAIKIIDLTCIKEEYARRNLHREPRVMAKLRHPCIAALYETMMHGPRLYVVMEAAGGGDLCAHVLGARGARGGAARGLPEGRARSLASQLVSAVRHMHARGVVHRDLKMENIMLDSTKQFIKIVDFGLSNVWSAGGALRTPCGSLEYAAPELFVDGHRYGPEVDLWSIGVIVYGMVTGGLPFAGAAGAESRSRPQLRADIARGFARKQRAALAGVSTECKTFVQHLLEPNVDLRMKIEEAARHRWVKRPGMRMNTHPFGILDPKVNRETYKQISELSGQTVIDIVAQIKADPFGSIAGMYNIKTHLHQMHAVPGIELLWSSNTQELRPITPPEYRTLFDSSRPETPSNKTPPPNGIQHKMFNSSMQNQNGVSTPKPQHQIFNTSMQKQNGVSTPKPLTNGSNHISNEFSTTPTRQNSASQITKDLSTRSSLPIKHNEQLKLRSEVVRSRSQPLENPRFSVINKPVNHNYGLKKPVYKVYDNGDCRLDPRLPRINEHSNTDVTDRMKGKARIPCVRKVTLDDERRLNSCPNKMGDCKRSEFYRRAGDGLTNWRTGGMVSTPPARILFQNNATTIKRASLGNIVSPHSSSNSHCKSERAMPVGWYSTRSQLTKETTHLQRLRRTVPLK